MRVRSAFFEESLDLHLEAADLLVERHRQRVGVHRPARAAALEAQGSVFHQLPFPLHDLGRMHLIAGCQLAQGVCALQRLQRHLRLKLLGMNLALLSHFSNTFRTLSGVPLHRVNLEKLYLAPVQKTGVT